MPKASTLATSSPATVTALRDVLGVQDVLGTVNIFDDTTAGLAATSDGNYFSVPSADANEYLILYKNETGSATEIKRFPSNYFLQSGTGAVARTMQEKARDIVSHADYGTAANFNAAKVGKPSIDAAGRWRSIAFIAGDEELAGSTLRDAIVVGRAVTGSTDCHGFADRTIMSSVTDSGTYGSFDVTVKLQGSNAQDHQHSYQDRFEYQGSGSITNHAGLYSTPKHSGTGTWSNRYGAYIGDVTKTGTGAVTSNIGVYIEDLVNGGNNVAVNIRQTTGNSIYAAGGAAMYHKGNVGIGAQQNTNSVGLTVCGNNVTGPKAYMHADASNAYFGSVGGDYAIQWVSNGGVRLELQASANAYNFRPGADNTQSMGSASRRWKTVYAGNVELTPAASVTPSANGSLSFELTNDTTLKIKVKGSDGIVRSVTLTLT